MSKNVNFVSHKKSKLKENGGPKLPLAADLVEGEIAINFGKDVETLSIKNESGDVVTFSSDNYYTEKKLGSGFTGENSGVTVTEALENIEIDVDQVIDSGTSASTNAVATKAVYDKIVEDEQVWAISLNQLNNNKFGYANFDGTSKSIEFYRDSDEILSGVPISTVDLSSLSIDIDQVIDSGTSASTDAVSTSAVYDFVTSYTPSITVDQVLDDTTSASTNPVSTKAVYKVVTDNELVLTNTFIALSGAVSSHTENTDIHVTAADKTAWNAKLDASAYTPTDLSNYYTKSETSGATEISDAFAQKLNISDFNTYSGTVNTSLNSKASQSDLNTLSGTVTAHTADGDIHVTTSDKTKWNKIDDKADTTAVTEAINAAVSGKTNQSDFSAHTANTTVHITAEERSTWNAKSDFSGSYNDLTDKPTIPTSASQLTNDAGYITSSALNGYGTCETAGGTAAKTASVDGLILGMNTQVSVLFNNGFTISNPTLSINGGTAHAMKIGGSALPPHLIAAKSIVTMIYDGTDFNVISIEKIPQPQTMDYVDLGLQSGLKWATMNVGATKPEEQGYFFSWGNVEGHCLNGVTDYDFGTSTAGAPYSGSPGAALSGNIATGDAYDMARANLGGAWRLPTKEEFQELYDNTTCTWTTQNGVAGWLFVSKASGNSNSVFFPAAGYYDGSSHNYVGSLGRYWSSSFISATYAYTLTFNSAAVYPQNSFTYRCNGFSVRAVQ